MESKKKTCDYREACPKARARFLKRLEKIPQDVRVWVDETGMNGNETYPYGWSPGGTRCPGVHPGNREGRVSIIAGLRVQRLVAPCWFTGSCNTRVFNAWLKEMLLPELAEGSVILLDNARSINPTQPGVSSSKPDAACCFSPNTPPRTTSSNTSGSPSKTTHEKYSKPSKTPKLPSKPR